MKEEWRNYSYSEKQIKSMARRVVYYRLFAMRAACSDTIDDIVQELSVAWLEAVEKYDPKGGASFSTFLHIGMLRHINRYIQKQYELQLTSPQNSLSIDESIDGDNMKSITFSDIITDRMPRADQQVECESCYNLVTRNLSERARQFVNLLRNPPIELISALDELSEKAMYAKRLGYNYVTVKRVSANIIFGLMGARRNERDKIIKEIRSQALSVQC